jgi:hypothetical protein
MKRKNQTEDSGREGALPEETVVPSPTTLELATLAARIAPEICLQRPTEAIEAATALIEAANVAIDSKREERELLKAIEQSDKFDREHADEPDSFFHKGYEEGVKLITGEKRWSRALRQFRAFLESRVKTEQAVDRLLIRYRQFGFTGAKIISLRDDFSTWKVKDKSHKARESRAVRSKK